eukprot:CAMPEP_0202388064 /NCGR_PEP_ID=MMETSP1127-20130417/75486_1 /ASSEMBLY_ACC=CAM_ASM_000462 /TAXON_ID=3047 /ORGANISM="Dunaliella tertiolecta, Strain CCMP1320" /LENGTH=38 /DNA_ID= /DNA_START= /DNA_END= /DNA_ORIENTATION=
MQALSHHQADIKSSGVQALSLQIRHRAHHSGIQALSHN